MSEYTEVEQPFLQQLAALGWTVVDQGQGIPQNPQASHRQHVADLQQRLAELVTEREALDRDIVATACKLLRQRGGGTQAATDTIYPPLPNGVEQ